MKRSSQLFSVLWTIHAFLTAVPVAVLFLFIFFAVAVRLHLGHSPVVYVDYLSSPSIADSLDRATTIAAPLLLATCPVWIAFTLLTMALRPPAISLYPRTAFFLSCIILLVLWATIDPTDFFAWWFD